MNLLTMENPVFEVYVIAAAIMALKIMLQGWMTVFRMLKSNSGLASPEDLQKGLINKDPNPKQLEINDYVDRSRRMHRNDLENIPAFFAAGLLFVVVDPALWLAQLLMFGFVLARLAHFAAYATKQTHEVRATFYTIGSLIVIYMAAHALWQALT
ncbi:MAPEG family protein [Pseudohoeflea coraliihabitans]|uniref:MAPEG family protein n=1 Tax=Pseudohoeflea coraliihabitans TaxID=2860393 RepID=A0ABS6WJW0_9HYPH|nr:MAPEG family protein [Pseudohoeflea sp. DP4N28-3]MBW3096234.1 MAPEG family protein [Pseudohoeflea sp. DP4N28-3]